MNEARPAGNAVSAVSAVGALDDPVRRRLYEFVTSAGGPVSRDDASAEVRIGRTLAAYHLDKLEQAGLLTVEYQRPEGRRGPGAGRPAKLYSRSEREISVTLPPRDYELLTQLLLESAEEDRGGTVRRAAGDVAHRMGRKLGSETTSSADPAADPPALLDAALRGCGYEPRTEPGGDITLRNCPFDRAAKAHREIVCGLNLQLLQGLMEGVGEDQGRAALDPQPGCCCVVIHPGE
jgi:predicted ArsR family transcriptional regulator